MKLYILKIPQRKELVFEIDCTNICLKFELKYGRYFSAHESLKEPDITIRKKDTSLYEVKIEKNKIFTLHPISCVERYLFDNPTYNKNILALHGSAVEWKGKSYVFLASTGTGKTTLVSYLCHCGCSYITEDVVLLNKASYDIYPCCTPLHLRDGGVEILRNYNALPSDMQMLQEGDYSCRYIYTPQNCIHDKCALGEIFFIERTEAENAILPMTITEKIMALMKSPITAYPVTKEYLKLLTNISAGYGKILRYADMNFVKEVIMQNE